MYYFFLINIKLNKSFEATNSGLIMLQIKIFSIKALFKEFIFLSLIK